MGMNFHAFSLFYSLHKICRVLPCLKSKVSNSPFYGEVNIIFSVKMKMNFHRFRV